MECRLSSRMMPSREALLAACLLLDVLFLTSFSSCRAMRALDCSSVATASLVSRAASALKLLCKRRGSVHNCCEAKD